MEKKKKKSVVVTLTTAFCFGEERQHITDAQPSASSKNEFSRFLSRAKDKDLPSIIKAKERELSLDELSCDIPSSICFLILAAET